MRRVVKKLGIALIIIITTMMILKSTYSPYESVAYTNQSEINLLERAGALIGDVGDFLLGLALYIPKAIGMGLASLLRVLVYSITAIGDPSGKGVGSVDAILFNEASITSIDFFDNSTNETINVIRNNVAIWYYVLRNLSIVILLGILLYVGIRMAISTVASDEAKYKKMFKDWAVSLALVFVLQYIMIFTIECNNVLVDILKTAKDNVQQGTFSEGAQAEWMQNFEDWLFGPEQSQYETALDQISSQAWHVSFSVGVSSTIVYIILVGITLIFLIMYIKRMLTVGFLIVISPLITVTYSIDKIGDGKSQALNAWLKEFVFNVLIQPFHCVIYLVFTSTAVNLLTEEATLASAVLAVIMIIFIFQGEKIVRKIFNFRASSLGEAIAGSAAIATGITLLKSRGEKDKNKKVNTKEIPTMSNPGNKVGNNPNGPTVGSGPENLNQRWRDEQNRASQTYENPNPSVSINPNSNEQGEQKKKSKFANAVDTIGKPVRALRNGTKKVVDGTEKLYGKLPSPVRKYLAASAKIATVGTMAALGASTGSGKGIMSGYYAGNSMNQGASARVSSRQANKLVMENEQIFAQAYKNYKAQYPDKSDQQIAAETEYMLQHGDPNNMDSAQREFYGYARQMQKTYSAIGENNVQDRMQETMALIASGDILPPKPKKNTRR